MTKGLRRCAAAGLAALLILASPGPEAWAAGSRSSDGGPSRPVVPGVTGTPSVPGPVAIPTTDAAKGTGPGTDGVPSLPEAAIPAGAPATAAVPVPPGLEGPAPVTGPGPLTAPVDGLAPGPLTGAGPARPASPGAAPIARLEDWPPRGPERAEAHAAHLASLEALSHVGGASRMSRLVLELQRAWDARRPEATPAAEPASEPVLASRPAAPEALPAATEPALRPEMAEVPAPAPAPPRAGLLGTAAKGLGVTAAFFISAMAVQQLGIEMQGAAMPALLQKTFGDFSVVADITILASLSSIVGRVLGPLVVQRLNLKRGYLGALTLKVAVTTLMAVLLANGLMSVPLLGLFYAVNGLLSGVALTAEKAIGPAIVGQSQEKLEKFGAWKQVVLEVVASILPIAVGAVVAGAGFMPILIAFPVAFGVSIAMLWKWLKIPEKVEALRLAESAQAASEGAKAGVGSVFREFFARIARGARVVWGDPALKYSFLAFTAYMLLNPFLYTVLAPAYGMRLLGPDSPLAAGVYGMLTGLYSFGGLLGGLLMLAEQRRLKRAQEGEGGRAPVPPAEIAERLRKSMLRWMLLGTVGLAAVATMALPLPTLGMLVSLPSALGWLGTLTLPALALVLFGIAQVVANIKQENYFISRLPEKDINDAVGFLGAASLGIATVGLVGLKFLFTGRLPFGWQPLASFSGLPGLVPFIVLAAAMLPLGAYYLYLRRRLDKASVPR